MACGLAWTRKSTLTRRQAAARRGAGGGWPSSAYADLLAPAVPVQQRWRCGNLGRDGRPAWAKFQADVGDLVGKVAASHLDGSFKPVCTAPRRQMVEPGGGEAGSGNTGNVLW
jgi:hypothetical protein